MARTQGIQPVTLSDLIHDLISEAEPLVEGVDYRSLPDKDKALLTAAYILEDDSE
ncbi:hypothetical protein LCGC14_2403190, partial [marine sediment metagenome]